MINTDDLRMQLSHVYWIGGPPDSGKTTIAELVAERHGFRSYHFDRHEPAHFARADATRHPALFAAHPDRMTTEERWIGSTPEEMARMTIASWSERAEMAFDDLLAMPDDTPIVAEGPGFFPDLLLPLLNDTRHAIWLIPTDDFKRSAALARGKPGSRHETSDPERATEQLIARDLFMGRAMRVQAVAAGMRIIDISDATPVEDVLGQVREWFQLGSDPVLG